MKGAPRHTSGLIKVFIRYDYNTVKRNPKIVGMLYSRYPTIVDNFRTTTSKLVVVNGLPGALYIRTKVKQENHYYNTFSQLIFWSKRCQAVFLNLN